MRKIANLETEEKAQLFSFFLISHKIESLVREDDQTSVWIIDDDDQSKAKTLYEEFLANPPKEIRLKIKKIEKVEKSEKKKSLNIEETIGGMSHFSFFIFVLNCVCYLSLFVGPRYWLFLLFGPLELSSSPSMTELIHYRLISSAFLHNHFFHILFNMMWFHSLAPFIDRRLSLLGHLGLMVFTAFCSHVVFLKVLNQTSIGYSGILYGYVGFIWVYDKLSQQSFPDVDAHELARFFVIWYIVSLFLTSLHMPFANTVHGVGALSGMCFGFLIHGNYKRVRKYFRKEDVYQVIIAIILTVGGMLVDYLSR